MIRAAGQVAVSVAVGLVTFGLLYNIGVRPWAAAALAGLFTITADWVVWPW